jgi:UDP-glucose 4-epimerase
MILITGGAGYIGSHTLLALTEAGIETVTLDNLTTGHRDQVLAGVFFQGDLRNPQDLEKVFQKYPIVGVFHFAASCYVGESVQDPEKYYLNNVTGGINLLRAMRRHQVNKIVFSSSCAVYGLPRALPLKEDHPFGPVNPYGVTKMVMERMLEDYWRAYGLNYVSLRYFNAAGADPQGRIGEDHDPETHLIPLALSAALGKKESLTIFGEDYPTPDGTCIRDYIHILDLAKAHLLAWKFMEHEAGRPGIFNLGNEKGFSVKEVIQVCEQVTGRKVPRIKGPRREGDPPVLVADSSRAREVLGWRPAFPDLETITATAWNWHNKRRG